MKILITGGTGFIGSNIVDRLILEKHEVYLISKNYNNVKEETTTFNPDVIIHCGWYGGNTYQAINDPNQLSKNIETSIQLIEALKEIPKKTKFIGFGSFAEYGSKNFVVDENECENPTDLYGLSKYTFKKYSEIICKQNNIDWVWVRPCYVYGPGDVSTRLIPTLISKFVNNQDIVLDECNKTLDYIYIDDFVEMFYNLLISSSIGTYNICSGKQYDLRKIIYEIYSLTNSKSKIKFDPNLNRNSSPYICGSNQKIISAINHSPKINLETGLNKTIKHYAASNNTKG
jgi:nucleoside-diphosphate-sugar epimerase